MEFSALKSNLNSHSCPLTERTHSCRLFPPPSMVLFNFLDDTGTNPRGTKFSYFLLQFALLLATLQNGKSFAFSHVCYARITFHDESCSTLPIPSLLPTFGQRKISEVATAPDMHTGATASQSFLSKYCQKQE